MCSGQHIVTKSVHQHRENLLRRRFRNGLLRMGEQLRSGHRLCSILDLVPRVSIWFVFRDGVFSHEFRPSEGNKGCNKDSDCPTGAYLDGAKLITVRKFTTFPGWRVYNITETCVLVLLVVAIHLWD